MNGKRDWVAVLLAGAGALGAFLDAISGAVPPKYQPYVLGVLGALVAAGLYAKTPHPTINPPK